MRMYTEGGWGVGREGGGPRSHPNPFLLTFFFFFFVVCGQSCDSVHHFLLKH